MRRTHFVLSRRLLVALAALVVAVPMMAGLGSDPVQAADLPLAARSPLVGFAFDDKPLTLPTQRNFQMAMLTASSELGRSCGVIEAYGWRMNDAEQKRVNQIFSSTVDRLRDLGYAVEPQMPPSLSQDVTLFAADRADRHFLFMWSAGEIGLVMTLCESSPPAVPRHALSTWSSIQSFPQDVVTSRLDSMPAANGRRKTAGKAFSPVGAWVGEYTCAQGHTGATLQITQVQSDHFDGTFHFYKTAKSPYVPEGVYKVYGQYDAASQRILINPGPWIERPTDFYTTVMVGSFDPSRQTFSAFFQGVSGCTSFEAHYRAGSAKDTLFEKASTSVKKTSKAKKTVKKAPVATKAATSVPVPVVAVKPVVSAQTPTSSTPEAGPASPSTSASTKPDSGTIVLPASPATAPPSTPVAAPKL